MKILVLAVIAGIQLAQAATEPLVFRTLLIIKRFSEIDHEGRTIKERMRTKDISAVSQAFKNYTPYWISRLTDGRIQWDADVVVSDIPLTTVSPSPTGYWVSPSDVREDIQRYVKLGAYDGVFIYWKPGEINGGFGWAIGPTEGVRYCGYTCVAFMEPEQWTRKNEITEVFIHEWLHQLEGFYGQRRLRLPRGGLHGADNYGFKHDNGWKDWYKAFLNGTIPEENKQFSGLGEAAWKYGTIREQFRIFCPDFITPERKRYNLVSNGSFETITPKANPWKLHTRADSQTVIRVDTRAAYEGRSSLQLCSLTGTVIRIGQTVKVRQNQLYLLCGRIKTENVESIEPFTDTGAGLEVLETKTFSTFLSGSNDWNYLIAPFNTWQHKTITICASLGKDAYPVTGTAWYDEIQLVPIKAKELPPINVRLTPSD